MTRKHHVPRTRGGGRYTEAMFWSRIRNALRKSAKSWGPKNDAKKKALVGHITIPMLDSEDNPVLYKIGEKKGEPRTVKMPVRQCNKCGNSYRDDAKMIEMDHIVPCGSLKSSEDAAGFIDRMFCEEDGFEALCKDCHSVKTKAENAARKLKRKEK